MGGTAMLPGFLHRLMAEIRYLVEKPKYKEVLATKTFKVHTPPAKPNYVAWLGGKNGNSCWSTGPKWENKLPKWALTKWQ